MNVADGIYIDRRIIARSFFYRGSRRCGAGYAPPSSRLIRPVHHALKVAVFGKAAFPDATRKMAAQREDHQPRLDGPGIERARPSRIRLLVLQFASIFRRATG